MRDGRKWRDLWYFYCPPEQWLSVLVWTFDCKPAVTKLPADTEPVVGLWWPAIAVPSEGGYRVWCQAFCRQRARTAWFFHATRVLIINDPEPTAGVPPPPPGPPPRAAAPPPPGPPRAGTLATSSSTVPSGTLTSSASSSRRWGRNRRPLPSNVVAPQPSEQQMDQFVVVQPMDLTSWLGSDESSTETSTDIDV